MSDASVVIKRVLGIPEQHITVGTILSGVAALATGGFGTFLASLGASTSLAATPVATAEGLAADFLVAAVTSLESQVPADLAKLAPGASSAEIAALAAYVTNNVAGPLIVLIDKALNVPVGSPLPVATKAVAPGTTTFGNVTGTTMFDTGFPQESDAQRAADAALYAKDSVPANEGTTL